MAELAAAEAIPGAGLRGEEMSERRDPSRTSLSAEDRARLRAGLWHLERAIRYAERAHCDLGRFAVRFEELMRLGLDELDVRFLVEADCVRQLERTAGESGEVRSLQPATTGVPLEASAYVITAGGQRFLREIDVEREREDGEAQQKQQSAPTPRVRRSEQPWPSWDRSRRCLFVGGLLVKRFRQRAPNQELVLDAFTEEGWPVSIDDPLPFSRELNPAHRLASTAARLSRA